MLSAHQWRLALTARWDCWWRKQLFRALAHEEQRARAHGLEGTVRCPLCGHQGFTFYPTVSSYDLLRFNARCPGCGAQERHRIIYLTLQELGGAGWTGRMLHFAPEACLREKLSALPGVDYQTADLDPVGVDFVADLQALPCGDATWDYLLCSHVLEHVEQDALALAEMRRVLRPGGTLVLCVPLERHRAQTEEFGEARHSLHGHRRIYGRDFVERVRAHFAVTDRSAENWPAELVVRHGLLADDCLLVCTDRPSGR
jgi:SAM-dependent methyltransferase